MLHVYRNQVVDWFVAESLEEAREAYRAHCLYVSKLDPDEIDLDLEQEPDNKPLTINDDDGKTTRTCAEWAAANGKGFLCSTEY